MIRLLDMLSYWKRQRALGKIRSGMRMIGHPVDYLSDDELFDLVSVAELSAHVGAINVVEAGRVFRRILDEMSPARGEVLAGVAEP